MRRTKIICTIGPASDDPKILKQMRQAGMDVCRLNLSHGTLDEQTQRVKRIRSVCPDLLIQADLQGPRIRTGLLKNGKAILKTGASIVLTAEAILGDENAVSISPASVVKDIKKGENIFLCDGTIELKVLEKKDSHLLCRIVDGGLLGERKGANLPHTKLSLPSITAKDKNDIAWAMKIKVDYLGLSFVRSAQDVLAVKKILKKHKAKIPVIAKIEKPEAVQNIEDIIKVSDGIMVARGDLGVEVDLENVPIIQKEIIHLCHAYCRPVIVATQMLESMVNEETPTRAEVSDVANAIFDGANAVMTSEETSVGKYPLYVVKMMLKIIKTCEKSMFYSSGC